jgi:hypothetical protein
MALSINTEKKAKQLANLKPRKKGDPGLPGAGRPRKLITDRVEQILRSRVKGMGRTNRTYLDVFAETGVKRAIAKSDVLYKEIYERIEGPVEHNLKVREEITGSGGGPVQISAEHFHLMLQQFYGIGAVIGDAAQPDGTVSVSTALDSGSEPPPHRD